MKKHLFLTGEKQVGKSTLICRLLSEYPHPYGGFFTKRIRSGTDGLFYTHLLRPGEQPCEENILFCCSDRNKTDPVERFELLGCAALSDADKYRLIVMDELGPHEEKALKFRERVLSLLDGDIQILGVLQKAPGAFLKEIAGHPSVRVVTVTEENRDELFRKLQRGR